MEKDAGEPAFKRKKKEAPTWGVIGRRVLCIPISQLLKGKENTTRHLSRKEIYICSGGGRGGGESYQPPQIFNPAAARKEARSPPHDPIVEHSGEGFALRKKLNLDSPPSKLRELRLVLLGRRNRSLWNPVPSSAKSGSEARGKKTAMTITREAGLEGLHSPQEKNGDPPQESYNGRGGGGPPAPDRKTATGGAFRRTPDIPAS